MQNKKIVVFGRNGQVARKLQEVMPNAKFVSSDECNFLKLDNIANFLQDLEYIPDIIINASAYTKVDLAEREQNEAILVNAEAVKEIATYCKQNKVLFVHYSTDYVFNGEYVKNGYTEDNNSHLKPLSIYGKSKLLGEQYITNSGCSYYIIRTSWVYSEFGNNFVKTMLNLIQSKDSLNVVNDQIGSPTFAGNIANITLEAIKQKPQYGIYHFTDNGCISWFDFASEIKNTIQQIKGNDTSLAMINPILTSEYKTLATRPLFSFLNKDKITNALNFELVDYKIPLIHCIKQVI